MMGLADRVEAWARRFGIPPPPGADAGPQCSDAEAQAAPSRAPGRAPGGAADDDELIAGEVLHKP